MCRPCRLNLLSRIAISSDITPSDRCECACVWRWYGCCCCVCGWPKQRPSNPIISPVEIICLFNPKSRGCLCVGCANSVVNRSQVVSRRISSTSVLRIAHDCETAPHSYTGLVSRSHESKHQERLSAPSVRAKGVSVRLIKFTFFTVLQTSASTTR